MKWQGRNTKISRISLIIKLQICLVCLLLLSKAVQSSPTDWNQNVNQAENNQISKLPSDLNLPDEFITSIKGTGDQVFVGTWSGLLVFNLSGRFSIINQLDGLSCEHICDLAVDNEGKIWLATAFGNESGVSVFSLEDGQVINYSVEHGLPSKDITSIDVLNNQVWVGTWGGGVAVFSAETGSWKSYNRGDGLADDYVTSIKISADGKVWIGTKYRSGVSVFFENQFINYNEHNSGLVNNSIYTIFVDEQEVWFGTWGGASRFDGQNWVSYFGFENNLADNFVRDIYRSVDYVFLGTNKGLTVYDGSKFKSYLVKDGLSSNRIQSLYYKKGLLWIGTDNGLNFLKLAKE